VSDVFQILSCLDEVMEEERLVKLRDVWMDVPVMIGDRIHIIMSHGIDETTSFIVDDKHNYLIHLPYYLVSGTVVADSFQSGTLTSELQTWSMDLYFMKRSEGLYAIATLVRRI
jgi:hypothetical protein